MASTGDFVNALIVEQEFARYYNKQIANFANSTPNIAAETVMNYSKESYDAIATPTMPTFAQNAPIHATAAQNATQARGLIESITPGTTGITERLPTGRTQFTPTTDFFRNELNDGIKQVVSGNKTYTEVIRDVVKKMANSGIRSIRYETRNAQNIKTGKFRTDRIEVITRRAIMTGIKDTITENAYEMARQMGTTFFEISLHDGARESHWWGGYRFSTVPTDIIDLQTGKPFVTDEDLREQSGAWLMDYNCRHYITPIGKDERPLYDIKTIRAHQAKEKETKEYKGKEYTLSEANGRMRELEREMRSLRLEGMLHKAQYQQLRQTASAADLTDLENPYTEAKLKYHVLRAEYTDFAEAFNMRPQPERITYDMLGRVF